MVNKNVSAYMRAIGKKGGESTAKKGKKYMSKIGKKGYEASRASGKRDATK
jgi:general stress protein YciG